MNLPFSQNEFLNIFREYNLSVWPFQIILFLAGVYTLYIAIKNTPRSSKTISAILAFLWIWMGSAYHILFFSQINKAAYLFGGLFIIQGIIFFYSGVLKNKITFSSKPKYIILSLILILYALIIYPLLGIFFNHIYPNSPTFGLPCPTTIFTLGILLLADKKFSFRILIIPLLWSAIGFSAALTLGIYEDTTLIIAGAITVYLFFKSKRQLEIP